VMDERRGWARNCRTLRSNRQEMRQATQFTTSKRGNVFGITAE
jgi:hypothetical protein